MDAAYYSNEASGTGGGPDLTASSDSSGVGGGGPGPGDSSSADFRAGIGLGSADNFNAPGDITGMGFGGVGQGPGGPPGGFGGNYYRSGGGGGGGNYGRYGGGGGNYARYGGASSAREGGGFAGAYGYGGAGGFGGMGLGTDLGSLAQNAGFGFGPTAGNPAGVGPDPSIVGGTLDAPAIQSPQQLQDPGLLTQGANDPNAAQPSAPGGVGSGPGPSLLDQALSILGGINPISTANAAEAPPSAGVPGSLPGSGGQPVGPLGYPGGANVGFVDPNLSAAPPSGYLSGAGSGIPGMFAGGGLLPSGLGGTASGTPAWPGVDAPPPSGFLGDTGSGIPGMFAGGGLVPGSTGAPLTATGVGGVSTAYETSPQGTDFSPGALGGTPSSFGIPSNTAPFAGNNRFSAGDQPDRVTRGDLADLASRAGPTNAPGDITGLGWSGPTAAQQVAARFPAQGDTAAVPPTDTAANLALQGVDSPPPGGPLTGGTGQRGVDPITGEPTKFGPDDAGFRLAGTTPDTETPPAPDSPAAIAQQTPQSGVQAVPSLPPNTTQPGGLRFTVTPSSPESAPAQTAPAPAPGGGGGGPAPRATATFQSGGTGGVGGAGAPATGGGGGYPDQRGGFERGQRRTIGQQIFGQGGMVSSLFGGGQLGDTVASLMAQLGIPAALIFAATRGGGARLPMVGGARAMSGAGQVGGFSPQFSRQLFPGPGIPALVGLGLGGAALGQRMARGDQPSADQGAGAPAQAPGPQAPPTLPARPADIGGGTQAENFITQRGGHTAGTGAPNLNPEFASRVQRAAIAYEAETGRRAVFDEMGRSKEKQAEYYNRFLRGGPRAAPPGTGRHVKGFAIDIPDGDFQRWMHRNARRFGLQDLRPELNDPNHFQMADPVLASIRQRQAANAQ